MSTTQTPDIDRAISLLIQAKVPPRIEDHVRGQLAVLMSLAGGNPDWATSVATKSGENLARLARLSGNRDLDDAARCLGAYDAFAAPAEQDKAAKAETIEKIARLAKSDPDKFGEFALQLALKARDTLRTAGHATTELDEAIKGLIGCRLTPDEAQVMCDPIVRLLKDAPDVDAAQAEHAVELAVAPDKAATEVQQ